MEFLLQRESAEKRNIHFGNPKRFGEIPFPGPGFRLSQKPAPVKTPAISRKADQGFLPGTGQMQLFVKNFLPGQQKREEFRIGHGAKVPEFSPDPFFGRHLHGERVFAFPQGPIRQKTSRRQESREWE